MSQQENNNTEKMGSEQNGHSLYVVSEVMSEVGSEVVSEDNFLKVK